MGKKKVIYMVVPCYNEEEVLDETTRQLTAKIQSLMQKKLVKKAVFSMSMMVPKIRRGRLSHAYMKNIRWSVDSICHVIGDIKMLY